MRPVFDEDEIERMVDALGTANMRAPHALELTRRIIAQHEKQLEAMKRGLARAEQAAKAGCN